MRENLASVGLLFLRVLAGAGIAYHGYGKVFGGHMSQMAEGVAALGFPSPLFFAWAASLSEFAGGICLVLGLGSRVAALMIFFTMTVAAFMTHAEDPLKVKELALAYWAISGALVLTGPGSLAFDRFLFPNKERY